MERTDKRLYDQKDDTEKDAITKTWNISNKYILNTKKRKEKME
ncbi:MAG: hypothetical protein BAJALOKI1v1_1510006 [Promethearchaeota archaeon]|nr:MAG: hypothetical protein BAJALOKI1v1_1510006 [Candidatus Lokiarchaeota archaeon]